MIVTTADLYEIAYGQYAIGAYNVNNLEQILGLFRGCIDSRAPFIIQLSKGARQYADKRMLEALIRTAKEIYPKRSSPCTLITAMRIPAMIASTPAFTAR